MYIVQVLQSANFAPRNVCGRMQLKDHYKTLGVNPAAALPEIKKAYRKLAIKYHPDKNQGNELSEAQFKEVNEAYNILSDSRKRAKYDDERWLSGMGNKTSYADAVTPAWLKNVCVELNTSLKAMDTYRMSQKTLQEYILLILADSNLGVLQQEQDGLTNKAIVAELLRATARLELRYLNEITERLMIIAGTDDQVIKAITDYDHARRNQEKKDKAYPYIIIAVTLALCVFMYFYSQGK